MSLAKKANSMPIVELRKVTSDVLTYSGFQTRTLGSITYFLNLAPSTSKNEYFTQAWKMVAQTQEYCIVRKLHEEEIWYLHDLLNSPSFHSKNKPQLVKNSDLEAIAQVKNLYPDAQIAQKLLEINDGTNIDDLKINGEFRMKRKKRRFYKRFMKKAS